MTLDGIALTGSDLVVQLRMARLRIAVTVLRLSVVAGHATAKGRLLVTGAFGGNADFTDPSPGSKEGSLVNTLVLPAVYEPGAGRRDKLPLWRTEDGCGRAVADDNESVVTTATSLLLPLKPDDSDSLWQLLSHVPA